MRILELMLSVGSNPKSKVKPADRFADDDMTLSDQKPKDVSSDDDHPLKEAPTERGVSVYLELNSKAPFVKIGCKMFKAPVEKEEKDKVEELLAKKND
ncbi:hypothetical protein G6F57_007458 [Rhizopus arrhizus]|nr:hypothetical protein G6F30_009909 [Rhizopus arrhizus]KAG1415280.1 hypothetical protein G6F58_006556 [Rhizopus delemar]KAG0977379.1 hypothetical protein G6F29_010114 [Rhizopus arrhizus]KAG0991190.1 hypothetical protein G6F28_008820 [Rhizopus arrhizus]KAG1005933.1 hypothetical protein G6F27_008774 [Rhizopus arrhizus]